MIIKFVDCIRVPGFNSSIGTNIDKFYINTAPHGKTEHRDTSVFVRSSVPKCNEVALLYYQVLKSGKIDELLNCLLFSHLVIENKGGYDINFINSPLLAFSLNLDKNLALAKENKMIMTLRFDPYYGFNATGLTLPNITYSGLGYLRSEIPTDVPDNGNTNINASNAYLVVAREVRD